jgi:hypothetical protein
VSLDLSEGNKMNNDENELEPTPKGQTERITPNQLFLLSRTIREYRDMLDKREDNIMNRHKLKVYQELIGLILEKGIDEVIDFYNEQKLSIKLKKEIINEMREEDD